jgi:thiamine-phosphate pyrophosphorylase
MAPEAPATDKPQLYLISPPDFDLSGFQDDLSRVLDSVEVACMRLALSSHDEGEIARAADTLRAACHQRDVAIVIDNHILLAERHGLDGVHLTDRARSIRKARKQLGPDAIVGCYCGTSRHDGMTAGEAGADYVSFGPVGETALADGDRAEFEIFEWWSQMIEVPVVAEGGLTPELIGQFGPVTDFFGIGSEIWKSDDPVQALKTLLAPLG